MLSSVLIKQFKSNTKFQNFLPQFHSDRYPAPSARPLAHILLLEIDEKNVSLVTHLSTCAESQLYLVKLNLKWSSRIDAVNEKTLYNSL